MRKELEMRGDDNDDKKGRKGSEGGKGKKGQSERGKGDGKMSRCGVGVRGDAGRGEGRMEGRGCLSARIRRRMEIEGEGIGGFCEKGGEEVIGRRGREGGRMKAQRYGEQEMGGEVEEYRVERGVRK